LPPKHIDGKPSILRGGIKKRYIIIIPLWEFFKIVFIYMKGNPALAECDLLAIE